MVGEAGAVERLVTSWYKSLDVKVVVVVVWLTGFPAKFNFVLICKFLRTEEKS